MRVLALLFALTACTVEGGRSDVVPVHPLAGLRPFSEVTMDVTAEILGLELDRTDARPNGAVVLVRVDASHTTFDGHDDWVDRCSPIAWAPDKPYLLAHEVGHTLGLEHVDDPLNVMWAHHPVGYELDDEQVDTMRKFAWYLQHKCP